MEVSKELALKMFEKMLLLRLFDEKIIELYRAGLKGLYHLSCGEEAVAVGVCMALRKDDYVLSTHRCKGHYIAKNGDIGAMLAEFMEKKTGSNKGKGGPMHIVDPSVGLLGANGIVGSGLPIACGAALSAQLRGSGQVAVTFFGDGAANTGIWHESMNLAAIWKLPVIFVCENNYYALSVPIAKHSAISDFYKRASGYEMPGYKVDGMDILAVYDKANEAIKHARDGRGPVMLECKTYRFRGHGESDPTRGLKYREQKEIDSWEENCPVKRLRSELIDKGWINEAEIDNIIEKCNKMINAAVEFAQNSPGVEPEGALSDVYAGE